MLKKPQKPETKQGNKPGADETTPYEFASYAEVEAEKMKSK